MLNCKSLKKIKKRLLNIIDSQFQLLEQNYLKLLYQNQHIINSQRINHQKYDQKQNNLILIGQYKINEAKLQDWILTLSNQLIQWQPNNMKKVHKVLKSNNKKDENQQNYQKQINKIEMPQMIQTQSKPKMLFKAHNDQLAIYTLNLQNFTNSHYNSSTSTIFQKQTFKFSQNTFLSNCSLTYIPITHSILFIGGSLSSNLNLKSNNTLQYCLKSNKLEQFSSLSQQCLPYGLSSHAAVYNERKREIYIIGGNRDHSVVSRGCFKIKLNINKNMENSSHQNQYTLTNIQTTEIACLNYPCSSSTCILSSSSKFIYKIGGIGQSFGQWGNSPYFQRYSIELNQWEVINPKISPQIQVNKISKYIFMANMLCYLGQNSIKQQDKHKNNQENSQNLVIFGGYNINGEATNKAIIIKLQNNNNDQQRQDGDLQISQQTQQNQHQKSQIIEFGQLNNIFSKKCGFNNNQVFSLRNVNNTQKSYIFSLATILNEQKVWTQQPVFFQI